MKDDKEFYTLKGYQIKKDLVTPRSFPMTASMEDYLEMICRMQEHSEVVRISALAASLHVKPSSASKMVSNLRQAGYIEFQKYGYIKVTKQGMAAGAYLLHRHQVLHSFLCLLNGTENELEQVEKIEHFFNEITIGNLEQLTRCLEANQSILLFRRNVSSKSDSSVSRNFPLQGNP